MANIIKAKLILERRQAGDSIQDIANKYHVAKKSIITVCNRAKARYITFETVKEKTEEEVYRLLFPEKQASNLIYEPPDYEYVQKELTKAGVTLRLLHEEYVLECKKKGSIAVGKTKYYEDYTKFCQQTGFTNRITHKPAIRTEVDWSGLQMHYFDKNLGVNIDVPIFVASLPFSQYCYVEACRDMKQATWHECHIHMWEYFGGSTVRLICDNLKTGVIAHPKEGDIILNQEYENLANHYGCAIFPAGVKKPKAKASVEGNVGNIETAIIAKLRNEHFTSLAQVKVAVSRELENFNSKDFDEREGSRLSVFLSEEKLKLTPLPSIKYESFLWFRNRKVQLNSHVMFERNYYSCPYKFIAQLVDLKVSSSKISIYKGDLILQTHERFPANGKNHYSTYEQDMPQEKMFQEWNENRILSWANSIGPNSFIVVSRILEPLVIKEQGYNSALSVLKLSSKFGSSRLEDACELALSHIHSPRWRNVNSILSSNQDEIVRNQRTEKVAQAKGFERGVDYYRNLKGGKK
ncbi:MAG: IS21 family transposase [Candidatus Cloacimonetes bacterium]|nr:IS21 family transposase [Candidatus Cloacimonadota bacterium]